MLFIIYLRKGDNSTTVSSVVSEIPYYIQEGYDYYLLICRQFSEYKNCFSNRNILSFFFFFTIPNSKKKINIYIHSLPLVIIQDCEIDFVPVVRCVHLGVIDVKS